MLSEKGYDNVYLLSGGCEGFLESHSSLVEGKQVPIPKKHLEEEEARRL